LFFIRFGFVLDAPDILADALRQHAHENEVAKIEQTPFGTRYVLEGPLRAPNGRAPNLRVVWFVEQGQTAPRLATAYPLAEAEEQKREGQDDQGTG